ncbi:hypothetical protein LPB86_11100 [Pedobacter sp. MC2016-14]|uniref:hypothetical protein n=1 Tax=Pedobacter sp. MC2016-14 TaxID=2897327 RepID=UPI001E41E50C|nr:hypothetical protein [Pedobacter sp. MC2016-14]MCD0488781.1 hypothetical protein [Pedobacter sp. MC2016-14]
MGNTNFDKNASTSLPQGYKMDREVSEAMGNFMAQHPLGAFPEKRDWLELRDTLNEFYANPSQQFPVHPEVNKRDFTIKTRDGKEKLPGLDGITWRRKRWQ